MPVVVDGAEVGSIAIYHDITELLQARRESEAANEANRASVAAIAAEDLDLVGLAFRTERKVADKVLDRLRFHP